MISKRHRNKICVRLEIGGSTEMDALGALLAAARQRFQTSIWVLAGAELNIGADTSSVSRIDELNATKFALCSDQFLIDLQSSGCQIVNGAIYCLGSHALLGTVDFQVVEALFGMEVFDSTSLELDVDSSDLEAGLLALFGEASLKSS